MASDEARDPAAGELALRAPSARSPCANVGAYAFAAASRAACTDSFVWLKSSACRRLAFVAYAMAPHATLSGRLV